MNRDQIVADLIAYGNRLNMAIEALDGPGRRAPRRGRPPKAHNSAPINSPKRRTMSAAARKLISEAQKARWAAQKANAAPKKPKVRRPMSADARKKLSILMKARWAARKS